MASVWSATDAAANGMTLSNGGLTVTPSGVASWQSVRGSISQSSGKLYIEFLDSAATTGNMAWGLASASFASGSYLGSSNYSAGMWTNPATNLVSGFQSQYASTLPPAAQNDVSAIAIDFTAGKIWLARNNVWSNASNPAIGALPIFLFTPATVGALFPGMSFNGAGNGVWTLQPTAASQTYAPPAGFSAWDASTDARATQVSIEQFASANPPAQVTQVTVEHWVTTATVTGQALVTMVALEQWASAGVVVIPPTTGAQARVLILA